MANVIVNLTDGDVVEFDDIAKFEVDEGALSLQADEDLGVVAVFAPGEWRFCEVDEDTTIEAGPCLR